MTLILFHMLHGLFVVMTVVKFLCCFRRASIRENRKKGPFRSMKSYSSELNYKITASVIIRLCLPVLVSYLLTGTWYLSVVEPFLYTTRTLPSGPGVSDMVTVFVCTFYWSDLSFAFKDFIRCCYFPMCTLPFDGSLSIWKRKMSSATNCNNYVDQ